MSKVVSMGGSRNLISLWERGGAGTRQWGHRVR